MVSDGDDAEAAARARPADARSGAGELDEATLYLVVRRAIKDALLDVVGTLLLVGVAAVVVLVGATMGAQGARPASVAIGLVAVAFGLYLAGATLERIPPAREWF